MKYFLLFLICIQISCRDSSQNYNPYEDYQKALFNFTCTDSQMQKAEKEFKFCNENTDFFSTYCYGTAIIRNCTLKKELIEKGENK